MNLLPITLSLVAQGAAQAPARTTFPDTPIGQAMRQLVEAVNAPTDGPIRDFASRLDTDELNALTPENHRLRLLKLREQSGGLVIERVADDGGGFMARTKRDGRTFMFRGGLGPDGKVGYDLRRWLTPAEMRGGYEWPAAPKSRREAVRAIQTMLDRMAKQDLWNGVFLVAKGDEVLTFTAHGVADRTMGVPIRKDTKFNLASAGKMFTAVLVGQLVQEGKLSLDDKLGKFRPDWPDATAREKVSVRMLLGHTGGLGSIFGSPNYDRNRRYHDSTELTDALKGEPLGFEPGSRWSYSNGGFVMLGSIVERVTGKPFMQVARERIFAPLGMTGTGWAGAAEVVPGLAPLYDWSILDPLGMEPKQRDNMNGGWRGDAHGGGYSTATDMLRFMRAVRTHRLVSAATFDAFRKGDRNPGYGLGFSLDKAGDDVAVGHNGYARADAAVLWDLDVTVIALGNDMTHPAPLVARQVRDFIGRNAKLFR